MVWDIKQEYVPESRKIVWEVAPYLKGRGLDIGAGTFKVLPHAISVDNGHHSIFGQQINPDVKIRDAQHLDIFATMSMDFVYSSHLLEHLVDPAAALKEWWRVLKIHGYLVMYLPHEDLYPKCGEPGANPDHKHDLNEAKLFGWLKPLGGWDVEVCEQRNENEEYSLLMVIKKRGDKRQAESYKNPKPEKTACVVRYGAFGDMMMAASVWAGLKKQGYHVTVFASPPGSDVITNDPNIDRLFLFDKDQVPNGDLGNFWDWHSKKYDKFVNLSESLEGTFLALPGRIQHTWPAAVRHRQMDYNYLQFAHELAGIEHKPDVKFYATDEERKWAHKLHSKMGDGPIVMFSLAGSSVHKTWSGLDNILASVMVDFPTAHVILVGGPECKMLEAGWENEPRIHKTCGEWQMRQTLAFLSHVDLVIGSETGVLNAACCMDMYKVVLLSHSTETNLTRDWVNTASVWSKDTECPGRGKNEAAACHQLHYGWVNCKLDKTTGTAQCQANISVSEVWGHVGGMLNEVMAERREAA